LIPGVLELIGIGYSGVSQTNTLRFKYMIGLSKYRAFGFWSL